MLAPFPENFSTRVSQSHGENLMHTKFYICKYSNIAFILLNNLYSFAKSFMLYFKLENHNINIEYKT